MTPNQLRTAIEGAMHALQDAALAREINAHEARTAEHTTVVGFVGFSGIGSTFTDFGSIAEYDAFVRTRLFSALLADGALLQMSYIYRRDAIVNHRLAYCPCPFRIEADEFAEFTVEDFLDSFAESVPAERVRLESSVRFDFDVAAATADHPASHLTLNRPACRIPVQAPLSPGHFIRFVVKHFYPDVWQASEALRTYACPLIGNPFDRPAPDALFLDWQRGGSLLDRALDTLRPGRRGRRISL